MICDPILCQPLNCTRQVHPEEMCCPICEGTWGLGGVPGRGLGEQVGSLWEQGWGSLSDPRHPFMAFLFLAEKKTGQEEQKLERARDSSEGESQGTQAEGAALSP